MIVYWVINVESIFPSIRRNFRKPSTIVFGVINLRLSLQECLPLKPEILCKDSCFYILEIRISHGLSFCSLYKSGLVSVMLELIVISGWISPIYVVTCLRRNLYYKETSLYETVFEITLTRYVRKLI